MTYDPDWTYNPEVQRGMVETAERSLRDAMCELHALLTVTIGPEVRDITNALESIDDALGHTTGALSCYDYEIECDHGGPS